MSSINAADRSSQEDALRQAREAYTTRESEQAKKENHDIKSLTEAHEAELQKLRDEHARELDELKSKTREAITGRDMRYQKEIDEMRDMHQKQLVRAAREADSKVERTQSAGRDGLKKTEEIDEQQKEILRRNFGAEIAERDKSTQEQEEKNQTKLQSGLNDFRDRLGRAHENELRQVSEDRDQKLAALRSDYANLQRAKDDQIKSLERNYGSQTERRAQSFDTAIAAEREDGRLTQENQREGFNRGLANERERYRKALDKRETALDLSRDELQSTADERINGRLQSLGSSYQRLKNDMSRARIDNEEKKNREVADVRDEFSHNLEVAERDRAATVDYANKQTKEEIARMNKANQATLQGSNSYYQSKLAEKDLRSEERVNTQKTEFDRQRMHSETANDSRFGKLKASSDLQQQQARAYYDDASQSMRENFETTLKDMRVRNAEEKQKLFAQFSATSAEADKKAQDKLAETTLHYETEIAQINDRHQKEMKDMMAQEERKLKETQTKDSQELQAQTSALQYRISKNEETHKRDLEDMQRKHEEALANLTKNRQA